MNGRENLEQHSNTACGNHGRCFSERKSRYRDSARAGPVQRQARGGRVLRVHPLLPAFSCATDSWTPGTYPAGYIV